MKKIAIIILTIVSVMVPVLAQQPAQDEPSNHFASALYDMVQPWPRGIPDYLCDVSGDYHVTQETLPAGAGIIVKVRKVKRSGSLIYFDSE